MIYKQIHSNSPFLYDSPQGKIVGFKHPDGTEMHFAGSDGGSVFALARHYYVDGSRGDNYDADGSLVSPYKTVKAALDVINADAVALAAAGTYGLTNYVVHIAPGVYSDNLTFGNEKYLRLEGAGVELSGTLTITQTQQTGDYYSRLEFVGIEGTRAEKGPAFKISGAITATRNNDSLTYLTFKGVWVTGNILFDTDGTWVLYADGSRIAGTVNTGTFADADSALLIESANRSVFAGAISGKTSFYNVDNSEFSGAIDVTPVFDCRITNSKFSSSVSIVATKNLSVDSVSLKAIVDRTPTLTGMTIVYLDQVANGTYKGIFDAAAPPAIGGTTPAAGAFTTLKVTTGAVNGYVLQSNAEGLLSYADPAAVANAGLYPMLNPKAAAQSIYMTYAATGSTGIRVADNDNIDFGTGNFTLVWKGSLPDWTPGATNSLINKQGADDGFWLYIKSNNYLASGFDPNGGTLQDKSATVLNTLTDGTVHEVVAVIVRETASTAGSVTFYIDGVQHGNSVAIAAATTLSISGSANLYINGTSAVRNASNNQSVVLFNRALTAAEVLDLYRNGIAYADKWGSQTAMNVSNFANSGTSPYDTFDTASPTGFHVISDGTGTEICGSADELSFVAGKVYQINLTFAKASGASPAISVRDTLGGTLRQSLVGAGVLTDGTYSYTYAPTITEVGLVQFHNSSSAVEYTISNFKCFQIGATLALESEGIQPAPGQWLDSSSNKLHAMQPATGSSLTRYKKEFEYRWTNTWTASSAAQYVGGLNQNVLSADHFITDIIPQATKTTNVQNLTLGDGFDAARFVTAFTPSATRTKQTIAAQNDGTNLKLVYTPAAEATMTVETIIRGFIWEP